MKDFPLSINLNSNIEIHKLEKKYDTWDMATTFKF